MPRRLKRVEELGTPEVVCPECKKQAPGRNWKGSKCPHCGALNVELRHMRGFLRERGLLGH